MPPDFAAYPDAPDDDDIPFFEPVRGLESKSPWTGRISGRSHVIVRIARNGSGRLALDDDLEIPDLLLYAAR